MRSLALSAFSASASFFRRSSSSYAANTALQFSDDAFAETVLQLLLCYRDRNLRKGLAVGRAFLPLSTALQPAHRFLHVHRPKTSGRKRCDVLLFGEAGSESLADDAHHVTLQGRSPPVLHREANVAGWGRGGGKGSGDVRGRGRGIEGRGGGAGRRNQRDEQAGGRGRTTVAGRSAGGGAGGGGCGDNRLREGRGGPGRGVWELSGGAEMVVAVGGGVPGVWKLSGGAEMVVAVGWWPRISNRKGLAAVTAMAHSTPPAAGMSGISLLNAEDSAALDADLMTTPGFSIDQLMELAGLSVACAIAKVYPPSSKVLIVCGPGNNGGDGLVAARHLWQFGYWPTCVYPKPTPRQLFTNLVEQCTQLGIDFLPSCPAAEDLGAYDVVVDAIFGFGFKGNPRPPFDTILADLSKSATPVVSVDVPSGWSVDEGDTTGGGLKPEMLVSLTAPKLSARFFEGPHHFLGGRFVPPGIVTKYSLKLPAYPGSEQCVRLTEWGSVGKGDAKGKSASEL
eukprot:jgi/Undpi1/1096/HiC_scaffold_10.g04559.m1